MESFEPGWRFKNGWSRDQARAAMMLDPAVANLNTGSYGPSPRVVFERAQELRRRMAEEPMDFLVRQFPPLLWKAREALARFLGGDPHRLIFTANVSVAINIVASGLRLASPGEVLMSDHEYAAMQWCWECAAQRQGLTVRTMPLNVLAEDAAEIVAAFQKELSDRTRLLFFSHVVSQTGLVMPVKEICALARARGIPTLIDGAHAPAMVPIAADDFGCDYYAGNCHKWMLAPIGAGFLHVGKNNIERLQPMHVSWGFHPDPLRRPDEVDEFGSTPRLRFLEFEGTRDPCPWLAVPAALAFQEPMGWERIREANEDLVQYLRAKMVRFPRLRALTPVSPDMHGFLTAYQLPAGIDVPRWRTTLWDKHHIEAPIFEGVEGMILRVSAHFYNTRTEIDSLIAALGELQYSK